MPYVDLPTTCPLFNGPHTIDCLNTVWIEVGCIKEGQKYPSKLLSSEISSLSKLKYRLNINVTIKSLQYCQRISRLRIFINFQFVFLCKLGSNPWLIYLIGNFSLFSLLEEYTLPFCNIEFGSLKPGNQDLNKQFMHTYLYTENENIKVQLDQGSAELKKKNSNCNF